jgi:transcriptional regulator with XRE-family HTH domain
MEIDHLTPNPVILEELGRRLARVRKQRGHSQEALAEQAGIGVATLRRLEDGRDGKLGSWLRVLKALEMAGAIDVLLPEDFRSPMAEAKRPRRRTRRDGEDPGTGFVWGDQRR